MRLKTWDGSDLTVEISNSSGEEFMHGRPYSLNVLLDEAWYEIPPAPSLGQWGFSSDALAIQDGAVIEHEFDISRIYGDLPTGTYRVLFNRLSVEFTVPTN